MHFHTVTQALRGVKLRYEHVRSNFIWNILQVFKLCSVCVLVEATALYPPPPHSSLSFTRGHDPARPGREVRVYTGRPDGIPRPAKHA